MRHARISLDFFVVTNGAVGGVAGEVFGGEVGGLQEAGKDVLAREGARVVGEVEVLG